MSAFTRGFSFGFMTSTLRNVMGGMLGFHNCGGWVVPTPDFYAPNYDMSNMYRYYSPMPSFDSISLFKYDNYTYTQPLNYNSYDYIMNDFSAKWSNFGDQFFSTKQINKKGDADPKKDPTKSDLNDDKGLKGKRWSELTDTQLREIYGNYTREITDVCDVSTPEKEKAVVDKLNVYLADKGVLAGKGQAFVDAQKQHGISATVLIGIVMNESGKGTSDLAKNKHNVGGVRIAGSKEFREFGSVDECIMEMARFLKAGYVDNSGRPLTKLYQVNAKYCPTADPTDTSGNNGYWARNVDKYSGEAEAALMA